MKRMNKQEIKDSISKGAKNPGSENAEQDKILTSLFKLQLLLAEKKGK